MLYLWDKIKEQIAKSIQYVMLPVVVHVDVTAPLS
jgi:hypothetical protein